MKNHMLLIWLIFLILTLAVPVHGDVRFNIVNESMPVWEVTTTDTAPVGSACGTFNNAPGDPDYIRGNNCDQFNRCFGPITLFENAQNQHIVGVYTDQGCFEVLDAIGQSYQGFYIETVKETAGGGIWYQGWAADGGNAHTARWLDLTVEFNPWLHAYDGSPVEQTDPLTQQTYVIEDKGIAQYEMVIELRYPSGGETFWRKVLQGHNHAMEGWPAFPFNNPPDEVFSAEEARTYRIPWQGTPSFVLYMKTTLHAGSGEVRSGDVGNAANARNYWSVSFAVSNRE